MIFFKFILVWHVLNPFTWQNWKFDQTMVKLLACFGGGFKCNRRVETIEKRHCFMTQIPHEIYRHSRTLQELKLDSNNIKGIGSILETRIFLKWRSIFLFLEKLERDIELSYRTNSFFICVTWRFFQHPVKIIMQHKFSEVYDATRIRSTSLLSFSRKKNPP